MYVYVIKNCMKNISMKYMMAFMPRKMCIYSSRVRRIENVWLRGHNSLPADT